ncbi:CoA-binding protein [Halosimplex litoreum]|uniref:CoA-binding protein n=1 Tax=Halosimplex litoreum TaxID=1198301 RepID=A0A7T3FZJ6_9EURY|nr:CoA-binding protein [Halosimplex litoreum]QPV63556.1 CoA-binding protein [Halosimplex litoreum]
MPVDSDDTLREILDGDTIAVVGLSSTPGKAAHDVPAYMREQGYEVIPVNPYAEEIFGREPYDSLTEVEETVDIVDVFRPTDEVPGIVDEALGRDDVGTVWLQLGIIHDDAGERAEAAGRHFVQDRCLKVEHGRLFG